MVPRTDQKMKKINNNETYNEILNGAPKQKIIVLDSRMFRTATSEQFDMYNVK